VLKLEVDSNCGTEITKNMESKLIGAVICQGGQQRWLILDKILDKDGITTFICINKHGTIFLTKYEYLGTIISFNNNESEFLKSKEDA